MWLLIAFALLILADAPAPASPPPPDQASGRSGEQPEPTRRRLVLVERVGEHGR